MVDKSNEIEVELSDEFVPLSKFLDDIFQMDQSDPYHTQAPKCLELLLQKQYEFEGTPLEKFFWNSVSLESFHIAQQKAFEGNLKQVKSFLNQSMEAAKKGVSDEWLSYVKGTKCYFDSDMEGLQKEISKEGMGKDVLKRLYEGYVKRESIDYDEDYSGN